MAKKRYTKKIADNIVSLIEKDSYTVAELCGIVGISERTYYYWLNEFADFADSIKKAKDKFDELCVKEAKRSLMKKIMGYSAEETKTVFVESKEKGGPPKPKIKEQTKTTKHFQPDTTSIIFLLTNKAPQEFRNRQSIDAKGDFNHNVGFGDFLINTATVEDEPEGGEDVQE